MLWKNRNKNVLNESHEDKSGMVLVQIDKQGKGVTVKVRSRVDGSVLFECNYHTEASDRPAYYDAQKLVDIFVKANGYHIDHTLSNVELPVVRTLTNKRSR